MSASGKDVSIPNLKSEIPSFCLLQYGSNKIPYKTATVSSMWGEEIACNTKWTLRWCSGPLLVRWNYHRSLVSCRDISGLPCWIRWKALIVALYMSHCRAVSSLCSKLVGDNGLLWWWAHIIFKYSNILMMLWWLPFCNWYALTQHRNITFLMRYSNNLPVTKWSSSSKWQCFAITSID